MLLPGDRQCRGAAVHPAPRRAAGFLKVVDERTLGFADFGGNHQYITLGNLSENPKAFLFLMDYANQRRVKVWGRAGSSKTTRSLIKRLSVPGSRGRPERAILFHVEAWDVNCPPAHHPTIFRRRGRPIDPRAAGPH